MSNIDVQKFKARILAEKERLTGERHRLLNYGGEGVADQVSELADVDFNHPADIASETTGRETDFALTENVDGLLAQIDNALLRIENGTFGICENCGKPIPP